jgi:hypothetical protein
MHERLAEEGGLGRGARSTSGFDRWESGMQ